MTILALELTLLSRMPARPRRTVAWKTCHHCGGGRITRDTPCGRWL